MKRCSVAMYRLPYCTNKGPASSPAAGLDAGPLFVQYGNLYIATEHRFISLDEYVHGRENVQYVSSTTNVTLALDGLMPWTDDSSLEIYSLDAAADVFAPETTTTPPA